MFFLQICILAILSLASLTAAAQTEKTVEVSSRGLNVRALELRPDKPIAGVILLAGGDGDLGLTGDGRIESGLAGNQLVRTRHAYAANGLAVLVPDLAPDQKNRERRTSSEHAADLGAMVRHMRTIAMPVVIVGTSRGTLSAANAVANLTGPDRPDAMVLTSAFLLGSESAQHIANKNPQKLAVPTLIVGHRRDGCRYTPSGDIEPFRRWLAKGGAPVETKLLEGGGSGGNPCQANSPHGFLGLDQQVVEVITGWVKALPK